MAAQIISSIIFIGSLILIFTEKMHRTIVAMAGAMVMIAAGLIFDFYTEEQAAASIDTNTIFLLLGMMILVALLEPTGFFEFLAVWVGRSSKGDPVRLLVMLGAATSILSMFLDNVTTVVLIAPVTILICEILGINPQPYLLSEAILSDTAGAATLVGDPPNILIASAAELTFTDFLLRSFPIVLGSWLVALGLLYILFRQEFRTAQPDKEAVFNLNPREALKDPLTARKVLVVIGLALLFFLLEEQLEVRPAFVALGAAAVGLVWLRPDMTETLKRIEWNILLFFGALFVIVGGMEAAGVLNSLSNVIAGGADFQPVVLGLMLLWVSAILSAVVDNVPITIALIPVIQGLGNTGMDVAPLWWALVFGTGFGGNGTVIGSTANIVVYSLSERTRHPITPLLWLKRGTPVMLATCITASLLYVLYYYLIGF